ncbi:MAG: hypothetical protein B7X54_09380 [Idiomarina sp. 34-48-12]|nr:MAG: hypothetical protein B7X54_09380 [Idiomarina sp. 34-48-12]
MLRASGILIVLLISLPTLAQQAMRDPTAPPRVIERAGSPATVNETLKLQSIQWVGEQRKALINGDWKVVGETVGPYRVTAIQLSDVSLRDTRSSKDLTIRLFGFSALPPKPAAGSNL